MRNLNTTAYLWVAALVATVALSAGTSASAQETCRGYYEPYEIGEVDTGRLTELSGLVVSPLNPSVMWAHNDSGDGGWIYALTLDGEYLGRWKLEGADSVDWEDIAYGPCADGELACLYIGDIGNNEGDRRKLNIYRVREPEFNLFDALDDSIKDEIDKDDVEKIRFKYDVDRDDDTPNSEAMFVDETGAIYLFTKHDNGTAMMRVDVPDDLDDRVVAVEVGVRDDLHLVTAADLAPSGDRFVIRTLSEAREFTRWPGQTYGEAFLGDFLEFSVASDKQGEAIAYTADGWGILATSERRREPIYAYECIHLDNEDLYADAGTVDDGTAKADGVTSEGGAEAGSASDSGCSTVPAAAPRGLGGAVLMVLALAGFSFRRR